MLANQILKEILVRFWAEFGGRKGNGFGFDPELKLIRLKELSLVVIPYRNQTTLEHRRDKFNDAKSKLHPFTRFGNCFVCFAPASDRHHIIQLQNGGINSKKNVVSLCCKCHENIHPWLKTKMDD